MTDPLPDPLVVVLGEIRDVLAEIRDQRKPPGPSAMPLAATPIRPQRPEREPQAHIIG
jgi:hypothetical protein